MKRKWISLMLICIMIIQMIPMSAFATEATGGVCGSGVTWRLDGDILYIEGEGAMNDFLNPNALDENPDDTLTHAPWKDAY